jgi:hypothetical protein
MSNTSTNKIIASDLTNNDIRVHIKIDDYKFFIGLEHEETCSILVD